MITKFSTVFIKNEAEKVFKELSEMLFPLSTMRAKIFNSIMYRWRLVENSETVFFHGSVIFPESEVPIVSVVDDQNRELFSLRIEYKAVIL